MTDSSFHVLMVGFGLAVIKILADPLQAATGFAFSHVLEPSLDRHALSNSPGARFFFFRDDVRMKMPPADLRRLAELEQPDVPTIHNMIMSDRLVKTLDYSEALAYASYLAGRMEELFLQIKPSVIIGGFDGLHSGIAMAVARNMRIPWFALNFTTIPLGMAGFCTGMSPDTSVSFRPASGEALRALAERTLVDFQTKRLLVRAYESANNLSLITRRLPSHLRSLQIAVRRVLARRFDKFTNYPIRWLIQEYLRKRLNTLRLPKRWFVDAPPSIPYLFIGLQMQPEAAIDVWAPFFADQFAVIEAIVRSTPPTHQILVKLHKSDADNYSPRQLERLRRFPGVRLVSPYARSRDFIEKASLVLAIQGTIAMEAALLGRPVLLFGDSGYLELPSVSKVRRITELPEQIRNKLSEKAPEREAIIRGLMSYLGGYAPGCYNDWQATPSPAEIDALADHFRALRDSLESEPQPLRTSTERV